MPGSLFGDTRLMRFGAGAPQIDVKYLGTYLAAAFRHLFSQKLFG